MTAPRPIPLVAPVVIVPIVMNSVEGVSVEYIRNIIVVEASPWAIVVT
jgi:hypothetical protein